MNNKRGKKDDKKMKKLNRNKLRNVVALLLLGMSICCGCFTSTRHVADIRPDLIKPSANDRNTYRIDKVILSEPELIQDVRLCTEKGIIGNYTACNDALKDRKIATTDPLEGLLRVKVVEDYDLTELEARHKEDTAKVKEALEAALLKFYPTVFTKDSSAIPLTVEIKWNSKFNVKVPGFYLNIFYCFWPLPADHATKYNVRVAGDNVSGGVVSAARSSETWETCILPIGLIPVTGESNWSKKPGLMKSGQAITRRFSAGTYFSGKCICDIVFDSDVDGEVLAAAVMESLNRKSN